MKPKGILKFCGGVYVIVNLVKLKKMLVGRPQSHPPTHTHTHTHKYTHKYKEAEFRTAGEKQTHKHTHTDKDTHTGKQEFREVRE